MQHSLLCTPPDVPEIDSAPGFNVVTVYEDYQSGKRANHVYDFLVENLGQNCRFANQMWKFEVLNIPKLHQFAVHDALQADILIISVRSGELPAPVRDWIELWLKAPHTTMALVALFEDLHADAAPIRRYLADVARSGKVEFFAHPDPAVAGGQNAPASGLQAGAHAGLKALSTLRGAIESSQDRGWACGT